VRVVYGDKKSSTDYIRNTLTPVWKNNNNNIFKYNYKQGTPLTIQCWDHDAVRKEFMGEFPVDVESYVKIVGETVLEKDLLQRTKGKNKKHEEKMRNEIVSGTIKFKIQVK